MTRPVLSPLPAPPVRSDAPVDFSTKADAFLGAFPTLQSQINSATAWIGSQVDTTASDVLASQAARTAAETARAQAQTARNEAVSANTDAQSAKTAAESANTAAQSAKTAAETARTQAQTARTGAEAARDDAEYWAGQAEAIVLDPDLANLIASKAPLESPELTGTVKVNGEALGTAATRGVARPQSMAGGDTGLLVPVGYCGIGAGYDFGTNGPDSASVRLPNGFYETKVGSVGDSVNVPEDSSTWGHPFWNISRSGSSTEIRLLHSRLGLNRNMWVMMRQNGEASFSSKYLLDSLNTTPDSNGILHSGSSVPAGKESVTTDNWYLGTDKQHTADATGAVDLDLATATIFDLTLTDNTTLTVSNAVVPAGETRSVVVRIRQGATARTLTWWAGVTWLTSNGLAPPAPASNKVREYILSYDGSSWIGRGGSGN